MCERKGAGGGMGGSGMCACVALPSLYFPAKERHFAGSCMHMKKAGAWQQLALPGMPA